MSNHIVSVKIAGTTYPYIQNPNAFEIGVICYEDSGTKKISVTKVEEFILG